MEVLSPSAFKTVRSPLFAVRFLIQEGTVWFAAPDICMYMDFPCITNILNWVADNRKKTVTVLDTENVETSLMLLNEAAIYQVVMGSNFPLAVVFQDWIFESLLPSVRKQALVSLSTLSV